VSGKLLAGGIGPHVSLRRCFATPIESQMADITQLLFRSGSKIQRRRAIQTLITARSPKQTAIKIKAHGTATCAQKFLPQEF
ncbi:MAG: hypothetical protein M3R41_10090, partial [Pseudomonadota bacterium]|nr:hypothetical protein [Pseudomonadota bacterium]